jgi:hypothetical protein
VVPSHHTPSTQSISILQPRSTAEQYWAARALSAETLLAARVEHHRELRTLTSVHDDRREQDKAMHEARYARLEALVVRSSSLQFLQLLTTSTSWRCWARSYFSRLPCHT